MRILKIFLRVITWDSQRSSFLYNLDKRKQKKNTNRQYTYIVDKFLENRLETIKP